ncbi:Short-chain dehydrogenase TIC 32, chloroplastic [Cucurbita argyrosperma subsp. argyrosperma]|nr:Short-chain dehydrogenase TIC 32, chloroplastic [Cucurbita argyrosperma subsp. argyrosperma]
MWLLRRKGPSGFSSSSTAEEVTDGIDGTGLTAIVTGASSGIGSETARVLALRGVHVIMGVRNLEAGRNVKETIVNENPSAKIDTMELDLSSMASVRKFTSDYQSSGFPLNILINNAGIMATPFGLSKDNIEQQFATNHLGHFLLTDLLLENMKKTAVESEKEGRIVNVSSEAHRYTYPEGIQFDGINDESRYNKMQAYGQSKLSNILHANELTRRLANTVGKLIFKNVQQGAATTCYVALHPQVKGVSGEYFMNSNLHKPTQHGQDLRDTEKIGYRERGMWFLSRTGPSGFSASSTAEEVTEGIDGTGLIAIVTGASSGIGSETARVLALRGVRVVMAVRNVATGRKVQEAIVKENPTAKVDTMELDLSSMASVRNFASNFNSSGLPLNILVNNAGVMASPFLLSKDKIELQFATNHVGHFFLTNLLLETLKKTATESKKEGRIVNVSSRRHQFSYREGIRFDKINDPSGYNGLSAYGQSKLANILHASQLARQLKEEGVNITANSLHPGAIPTNLFRYHGLINATTCYVALHPQMKGISGQYFADGNVAKASSQANDSELAKKLWDFTQKLISTASES